MRTQARTAVITDLSVDSAARTERILADEQIVAVAKVFDGKSAYEAALTFRPDIIVADAVMPCLDGAGLAKLLLNAHLTVRPAVIIAAYRGMAPLLEDSSICIIEKPICADELREAILNTQIERRAVTIRARKACKDIFDRLGIPEHPGRDYLMEAAYLTYCDVRLTSKLTKTLYPMVADRHKVTPYAVERAMRHAIERAWAQGNIDEQYGFFKGTIDAARGKPTCGGMIAQLAEMLRMEDGR